MSENKPKVLVVSSIAPTRDSGGELILYRHLANNPSLEYCVVPKPPASRHSRRLSHTRLHRWMLDLHVLQGGRDWDASARTMAAEFRPNIIVTVAHEEGCWAAERLAQAKGLPLATFFHDWWPDISRAHRPVRRILDQRFVRSYQRATVALCVSEGMKIRLGEHPRSEVLYPIPEAVTDETPPGPGPQPSDAFRVYYHGNLWDYAPMLRTALEALKPARHIQLTIRGRNPQWPSSFCQEMKSAGRWLEFATVSDLWRWLNSASAFLVPMVFDSNSRRRMETSFPSKLTDVLRLGKPVVVWGPEYSSAVRWARQGDYALCVTQPDPAALVSALESLRRSPERRQKYAEQSLSLAQGQYNPSRLQHQFNDALKQALAAKDPA